MKIVTLPPEDYPEAWSPLGDGSFGPWQELWIVTDPPLSVRVKRGWIVEIASGSVGSEALWLIKTDQTVRVLDTKGRSRLAFRARRREVGDARWISDGVVTKEAHSPS